MEIYNPLIRVEHRLGNIETWPSSIIGYLFLVIPSRRIIKNLTAFFYGNGISPSLASTLYELCNVNYTANVASIMRNFYLHWQRHRFEKHLAHYYDIRLQRYLWINGSNLNQREDVHPVVTVIDFGIEGCHTQHAAEIRNKIWLLRGV